MTTTPNPSPGSEYVAPSAALLPDELLEAGHRLAARRAASSRALRRARTRRRILPAVVVASLSLLGAGLANAFVNANVTQQSAATTVTASGAASQNAINTQTLTQVTKALALDQRVIAALAASTLKTSAGAAGHSTTVTPTLAAPVAVSVPTTHATTGASGVPAG